MLQAARDAVHLGVQKFREQLVTYMAESEFTQPVQELTKRVFPKEWFDVLGKAEGVDGLVKLFGACRRQLEEFPEHPGLLLLTGFCRLHYGDEGFRDIGHAFFILQRDYHNIDLLAVVQRLISMIKERFPNKLEGVLEAILNNAPSREIGRLCYAEALPYGSAYAKAFFMLVGNIVQTLRRRVK